MENNEEKKSKSKFKIVIVILLIIIIAAGSVFAGFFIASKRGQTTKVVVSNNPSQAEQKLYALGDFVINLGGSDTGRYIKVNIYLGYGVKNKKLEKQLESKKQIIRDKINMYLLTKKSSDINHKGLIKIKEDLLKQINSLLSEGQITNIYFDSIIVQ